ncbi:hypothetical protein J7T55_009463 [Diaporthe amygdali]|uniref:uncharacterized protein n=1 Tax=Phomopsis amygdali TaxID=1214568 RepID=UPI0022FEF21A|nr:uncharacterized protein J7T55_009463 [Diaporthe amygdali]KAJ0104299.1 hypothetical protein J7T55_009463 [Diaporthe amygdali]
MAPDVNSKRCRSKQPPTTLNSCWVDDLLSSNSTVGLSQENGDGPGIENTKTTEKMGSYFRDAFYNHSNEPRQQGDNKTDGDGESERESESNRLDGDAILPELIKLTIAQQRMILSLRDANKEADVQLRINNARLDLVEEELSLMRSSLAEQAHPSLFSGVRMNSNFGGTGRDIAGDYVPAFDLSDIAATLAAGPGPVDYCFRPRHLSRDSSPSSRSSKQRNPRPEREEHVKRTRISYDGVGGQDPKIPPSTYVFSSATHAHEWSITVTDDASLSEVVELDFPRESSTDTVPDLGVLPQPSLLSKLCGKMARLLLGT